MNTICIMCPMGCPLEIEELNGKIVVRGNTCKRGATYGEQEFKSPKRVVTSLVKLSNGGVVSVKTNGLINKSDIFPVLEILKTVTLDLPIKIGDIVLKNILNSGVDVVATSNVN
ncbi:MAG: DUF1667 domain-containing protein [Clostridia bacterium]